MKLSQICLILLLLPFNLLAQQKFENTLSFNKESGSPKATLADIAWIAGTWRGQAMGGAIEEIWSNPMAGSMMGSFKYSENNEVIFYEIEAITQEDSTLILRLKHFNANLKGWEEKNDVVEFRLVKIAKNKVYFDDLTFEKVSNQKMNIYVVIGKAEDRQEEKLNYVKVTN